MRLKYVGPHQDGVTVEEIGLVVEHGEIIEVPDDVGKRLAANGEAWQVTSRTSKGDDR